jgi:hypothetical protein
MKSILFTVTITLGALSINTYAQTKKTNSSTNKVESKMPTEVTKTVPKMKSIPVFLGKSDISNGFIPKHIFDSLALQGLFAKDSSGIEGAVKQFRLYYKERNLFEDSSGNFMIMVDLLTDISMSNQLNKYVANSLTERTKKGDTAFIDDIIVKMPDSTTRIGLPMKLIIDK